MTTQPPLIKKSPTEWHIVPNTGEGTQHMRVSGIVFATESLINGLDPKTLGQVCNVASLPGIVGASMAMPDAHSGYGFPIGGVAAFDAAQGGVISAGGVGFDIACGVRSLVTGLTLRDVLDNQKELADLLHKAIPSGVGKGGHFSLSMKELDAMLEGGAVWAVSQGYGTEGDLEHTEEGGKMRGADSSKVSQEAKQRFVTQLGTLGSGNHYLEIQHVDEIYEEQAAAAFGIKKGDILLSIHCGSRGLGHQIGKEFLDKMEKAASGFGIDLPDKELACAPINSPLGQEYLGAMRAGINCALANRQVLTHLARKAFAQLFPKARLRMIYDVSHNTCKEEKHMVDGQERTLFVHRKGATRAFGPNHPELPAFCRKTGQPVLVGGSMGTASYILAGCAESAKSFCSANHGAGRRLSRTQSRKRHKGKQLIQSLQKDGIFVRSGDMRGIAEEAPAAYKDVDDVVLAAEQAGLARRVARCKPLVCVKG